MHHFKKILVATDFSPDARQALEYALTLAKPLKAKVYLLTVLEGSDLRIAVEEGVSGFTSSRDLARRVNRLVEGKFQKLESEVQFDGVERKSFIRRGRPFLEIVKAAKKMKADLIVMGTRGLSGIKEVLLGSTAERVIRQSPCPVLTIRG